MPKIAERGPFGIFQHPFCRKTPKKLKGGPLVEKIFKESLTVPKKNEGGRFSLARYCMIRGKKEKGWSLQVYRKKH